MNDKLNNVTILPPFKKFCMTIGELPSSYLESMTYYESLLWLTKYLGDTVIPALNANGEAVIELQEKYIELKNYVDNYFENLDVQEEINNKLDEMAEQGELAEIIAQYLEFNSVIGFDTKAALKSADNLVDGSITRTIGTDSYNDGKGNYYKIRKLEESDVIDDDNLLALSEYPTLVAEKIPDYEINQINETLDNLDGKLVLNFPTLSDLKSSQELELGNICQTNGYHSIGDGGNAIYKIVSSTGINTDEAIYIALNDTDLVAELVDKEHVNFEIFGAYGDGTHNDTSYIQNCINYLEANGINNFKGNFKTYLVTSTINITKSINFDFANSTIKTNAELSKLINVSNTDMLGGIKNVILDGNNVTDSVMYVDYCANYTFSDSTIMNVNAGCTGLHLATDYRMFEFKCLNVTIIGNINITDNVGIYVDASDAIFDNLVIQRCNTAMIVNKSLGLLSNAHFWVYTGQYQTSRGIVFNVYSEENMISNVIFDGFYKDIVCLADTPVLAINNIHSYIGNNSYPDNQKYFLWITNYTSLLPISFTGGIIKGTATTKLYACNEKVNLKCTNVCFDRSVNTNTQTADYQVLTSQTSLIGSITYNLYSNRFNNFTSKAYEFYIGTNLTTNTEYTLISESNLRMMPLAPRDYITKTNGGKEVLIRFDRDGGNFKIIPQESISSGDTLNVTVLFVDNVNNFNPYWE